MLLRWIFTCLVVFCLCLVSGSDPNALPRFVDLSHWLDERSPTYPIHTPFKITFLRLELKDIVGQSENLAMSSHFGTHIDAPVHMSERGWKLHEIPPENLYGPGVVISMKRKANRYENYAITIKDIRKFERKHGNIPKRSIVLFNTGWSQRWNNPAAFLGTATKDVTLLQSPGLSKDAAEYLVRRRNIVGIGVDTISYDVGNTTTYESHVVLSNANKWGLENVANLNSLPPTGCNIYVFPLKLIGASGAPARVVAFCNDTSPRP